MVPLSDAAYTPTIIKGLTIHPRNPMRFSFIVDPGEEGLIGYAFQKETTKLVKYFLAALTVPEDEQWVNLSPYEKERIVPEALGVTEMGRDLLAQDYLLKQMSASLMYPEDDLGKEFWQRVHEKANELFGPTNIPINTFNKVWIVPDKATVYEHEDSVFVVSNHLKVMLEEDYLALQNNAGSAKPGAKRVAVNDEKKVNSVSAEVMREVLLPELEREVNEGRQFANLRQIYNSMLLATWYKRSLKESLLGQLYADKNKVKGVDLEDKNIKEKIYEQYLAAFKQGVFNFIKEDYDPATRQKIPRKYFSGGAKGYDETKIDKINGRSSSPGEMVKAKEGAGGTSAYVVMYDFLPTTSTNDAVVKVTEFLNLYPPGSIINSLTVAQRTGLSQEQVEEILNTSFLVISINTGDIKGWLYVGSSGVEVAQSNGRTDIPAEKQLAPQLKPIEIGYVHDDELQAERVKRPADYLKEYAGGGDGYAFHPALVAASLVKLNRDLRSKLELEINAPNYKGLIEGMISYLESRKSPSAEETKILGYLKLVDRVFKTTGLTGSWEQQLQKARTLKESDQVAIQEETEAAVKDLLMKNKEVLAYFMPQFADPMNEVMQQAIKDIAIAQGFYSENAVLAAYYRAFQLLVLTTFPLYKPGKEPKVRPPLTPEESLLLGLTFYRTIYQSGVVQQLSEEQEYLKDVGPLNYAANLAQILKEGDSLLMTAIRGDEDLTSFIKENKSALIDKLSSEPYVGRTPDETRLNIAGVPVDFFGAGRPSGFTVLSLVAAATGQMIQKVGERIVIDEMMAIKQEMGGITDESVDTILQKAATKLDWMVETMQQLGKRDIRTLTPFEQLLHAAGLSLNESAEEFSVSAHAENKANWIAAYVLKSEETVKAQERPVTGGAVRTRGGTPARRTPAPKVYVPAQPKAWVAIATASKSQLDALEPLVARLPNVIPPEVRKKRFL